MKQKLTSDQAEQRILGYYEACKLFASLADDLKDHEDGRVRLLVAELKLKEKQVGDIIKND